MNDLYVCKNCFQDECIQEFIESTVSSKYCSFCHNEKHIEIASPISGIAQYIKEQLYKEYDLAADNLPFESREGGYQGIYWDT